MALYSELKIYKDTYELLLSVISSTSTIKKEFKFTLGEHLKSELIRLTLNIWKANSVIEKKKYLESGRENIENARLLIRLLFDLKQISIDVFSRWCLKVEELSRQLSGWIKSQQTNQEAKQ